MISELSDIAASQGRGYAELAIAQLFLVDLSLALFLQQSQLMEAGVTVLGYRNRPARVRMCRNSQIPMSSRPIGGLILVPFEKENSDTLVGPIVPETLANGLDSAHSPSRAMGYFPEAHSPRSLARSIQPTSLADLAVSSLRARSGIREDKLETKSKCVHRRFPVLSTDCQTLSRPPQPQFPTNS